MSLITINSEYEHDNRPSQPATHSDTSPNWKKVAGHCRNHEAIAWNERKSTWCVVFISRHCWRPLFELWKPSISLLKIVDPQHVRRLSFRWDLTWFCCFYTRIFFLIFLKTIGTSPFKDLRDSSLFLCNIYIFFNIDFVLKLINTLIILLFLKYCIELSICPISYQ